MLIDVIFIKQKQATKMTISWKILDTSTELNPQM